MNMNLVKFSITADKNFIRLHPVSHDMIEQARKDDREAAARYLVLSHDETRLAIKCLEGNSAFNPFFDDGIHLIKFGPGGFREIYLSSYIKGGGGKYENFWFDVPGAWLAQKLETTLAVLAEKKSAGLEETYEYIATNGELCDLARSVAPQVIWRYGEGVQARVVSDLDCPMQEGLQRCLDGLTRIAENYSHGVPSVINLHFETFGTSEKCASYYFGITNGDRQIINGGIIAHKTGDSDRYSYSTHT